MLREALTDMHLALRFGPEYCPPDLFVGSVPAIVRGLKVHANNISHARHVALEATFPRLVSCMGLDHFHAVAETFLDGDRATSRCLDAIGRGFDRFLDDPMHRDLARAEWAWLEAFQAGESHALELAELAALDPAAVIAARFGLHPAARWLLLEDPHFLTWDKAIPGEGHVLLLTRPQSEVLVHRVNEIAADILSLLSLLSWPCPASDLLSADPATVIALIDAGAVVLEKLP